MILFRGRGRIFRVLRIFRILRILRVFRILRILRVFRILRIFRIIRMLRMLGLFACANIHFLFYKSAGWGIFLGGLLGGDGALLFFVCFFSLFMGFLHCFSLILHLEDHSIEYDYHHHFFRLVGFGRRRHRLSRCPYPYHRLEGSREIHRR